MADILLNIRTGPSTAGTATRTKRKIVRLGKKRNGNRSLVKRVKVSGDGEDASAARPAQPPPPRPSAPTELDMGDLVKRSLQRDAESVDVLAEGSVPSPARKQDAAAAAVEQEKEEEAQSRSQKPKSFRISSLWSSTQPLACRPAQARTGAGAKAAAVVEAVRTTNAADLSLSFAATGLHERLTEHLAGKMQLQNPTAVQQLALTHMLAPGAQDWILQAQTGSGKTLAYLLPVLDSLLRSADASSVPLSREGVKPLALILAPTRELAKQIYATLEQLLSMRYPGRWIVPCCLSGGEKKHSEKGRLRKGVAVIVSTPGRLLDHLENTEVLDLRWVKWLVVDEADRFSELGFEADLKRILGFLDAPRPRGPASPLMEAVFPQQRSSILCSATSDLSLVESKRYKLISAEAGETQASKEESDLPTLPAQLKQSFLVVPAKLKLVALLATLQASLKAAAAAKIIVFFSTCDAVEFHHAMLSANPAFLGGADSAVVVKLHGDMAQSGRDESYRTFSASGRSLLLTTSVAGRGLHLPNVTHIVQYDVPPDFKEYVHRVGRTARAGKTGSSVLVLMDEERAYMQQLQRTMQLQVTEQFLGDLARQAQWGGGESWREHAAATQELFEKWVYSDAKTSEIARRAYVSFVRSYATFPAELKAVANPSRLHLGHVAKSYGLRESPSTLMTAGAAAAAKNRRDRDRKKHKG